MERKVKVDKNGFIRCRVCGCTEIAACQPPCSWVGNQDLCSGCFEAARALGLWVTGAHRPNLTALLREFKRPRWEQVKAEVLGLRSERGGAR